MKVTIEGTYYITNRKIKEIEGFEETLEVKDGLKDYEIMTLMMDHKSSPLIATLKKKQPKYVGLRKIKLVGFKQVIPADEEVDTLESLALDDDSVDGGGVITADKEFGDIAEALGGAKKKGK